MKTVVLGATGEIGHRVSGILEGQGHEVVRASRATGVDARRGTGLADALAGAETVIDCLNLQTLSGGKSIDFFSGAAGRVARAAADAGVGRVVCVSIVNATVPEVNEALGYYQGKAAQERVYRHLLPASVLTIFRTTQWFELAETLLDQVAVGPVAAVPHMLSQPLAAADAAGLLAACASAEEHRDIVEVSGPETHDMFDLAGEINRRRKRRRRLVGLRVGGAAINGGGLLPHGDTITAPTDFETWLDRE